VEHITKGISKGEPDICARISAVQDSAGKCRIRLDTGQDRAGQCRTAQYRADRTGQGRIVQGSAG
jgi:hypothetical protein